MAQDDTSTQSSAEIENSLAHLGRLSGWIAHEVNNALGGIHSSFALLRRLIPEDHPHFRYVAAIDREVARASALTERIQHSYECDPAQRVPMSLHAALAAAGRANAALCRSRNVTLAIEVPPGPGVPPACSPVEAAAIRHLLQHVIEHAEDGRVVAVRGEFDASRITVTVPNCDASPESGKWPLSGPAGLAFSLVRQLAEALDAELIIQDRTDFEGTITLAMPRPLGERADAAGR